MEIIPPPYIAPSITAQWIIMHQPNLFEEEERKKRKKIDEVAKNWILLSANPYNIWENTKTRKLASIQKARLQNLYIPHVGDIGIASCERKTQKAAERCFIRWMKTHPEGISRKLAKTI